MVHHLTDLAKHRVVCNLLGLGDKPTHRHDNAPLDADDPLKLAAEEFGPRLAMTGIILWVKGDWAEVSHTLGLPSVTSKHAPGPFCDATCDNLHERYRGVFLLAWPWRLYGKTTRPLALRARFAYGWTPKRSERASWHGFGT